MHMQPLGFGTHKSFIHRSTQTYLSTSRETTKKKETDGVEVRGNEKKNRNPA